MSVSWAPEGSNPTFEEQQWAPKFQGIYLVLCMQVHAERWVLGTLSELAATNGAYLASSGEGEQLAQPGKLRRLFQSLATLMAQYTLTMPPDDCGGPTEYVDFFEGMRRVFGVHAQLAELRQELAEVTTLIETKWMDEQRAASDAETSAHRAATAQREGQWQEEQKHHQTAAYERQRQWQEEQKLHQTAANERQRQWQEEQKLHQTAANERLRQWQEEQKRHQTAETALVEDRRKRDEQYQQELKQREEQREQEERREKRMGRFLAGLGAFLIPPGVVGSIWGMNKAADLPIGLPPLDAAQTLAVWFVFGGVLVLGYLALARWIGIGTPPATTEAAPDQPTESDGTGG